MIWFFIVTLLLTVSIIVYLIDDFDHDLISGTALFLILATGITISTFAILAICTHSNTDAKVLELEAEKEAIVYQLNNQTYLNDNNLGTVELFKQASEFNQKVVGGQKRSNNPWTSWLVSPAFNYVEPITFDNIS